MRLVTVATCALNQWALDFEGNLARTIAAAKEAQAKGASFLLGPELQTSGYGCEDHFLEPDTFTHSWEVIEALCGNRDVDGIVLDIGAPVLRRGVRYNCRVFVLNGRVLLIRPKLFLATDGNYRESRWFAEWPMDAPMEDFTLPHGIKGFDGGNVVPFGLGALEFADGITIASETCEELFTPDSPHIPAGLDGIDIISNGSGSHHELRKLNKRLDLIRSATLKSGGAYLYANQQGCDGGRLYYDGCACVAVNGDLVAQGSQFSIGDVEVITAAIDVDAMRTYRGGIGSRNSQAAALKAEFRLPRVKVNWALSNGKGIRQGATRPIPPTFLTPEEEIAMGPACWLWDYLRRSGMAGFMLPLSGGADSSATLAICGSMCRLVVAAIDDPGGEAVLADVRRLTRDPSYTPRSAHELAGRLLYTVYLGTANSSGDTRDRAARLSEEVGANHNAVEIDSVTQALLDVFAQGNPEGKKPEYKVHGGSERENLALQNIQARSRMVLTYLWAQLGPWADGHEGTLLVLGSANVDEALRGYLTKYDCSSADINPIGGISKTDLKSFLRWASKDYPVLADVVEAPPTAELEPITDSHVQTDEEDMGMSYEELSVFGRLRKMAKMGPVSMWQTLVSTWGDRLNPEEVADRVKRFFRYYSINRHKLTVLTPSYHAESYSPEDNRYDLRPFLYNVRWTWQFRRLDEEVELLAHDDPRDEPRALSRSRL